MFATKWNDCFRIVALEVTKLLFKESHSFPSWFFPPFTLWNIRWICGERIVFRFRLCNGWLTTNFQFFLFRVFAIFKCHTYTLHVLHFGIVSVNTMYSSNFTWFTDLYQILYHNWWGIIWIIWITQIHHIEHIGLSLCIQRKTIRIKA